MNKLKINIGQPALGGIPMGDPIITFEGEKRLCSVKLKDLKDWINCIWDSKGNQSKKAYDAKRKLEEVFSEIANL